MLRLAGPTVDARGSTAEVFVAVGPVEGARKALSLDELLVSFRQASSERTEASDGPTRPLSGACVESVDPTSHAAFLKLSVDGWGAFDQLLPLTTLESDTFFNGPTAIVVVSLVDDVQPALDRGNDASTEAGDLSIGVLLRELEDAMLSPITD